jgi:hypothetical protein
MQSVTGYISVVQEQRFRLITQDGQGLLLTLARNAPLTGSDLSHWQADNVHVVVEYTGVPNLDTGVAHTVQPSAVNGHANDR